MLPISPPLSKWDGWDGVNFLPEPGHQDKNIQFSWLMADHDWEYPMSSIYLGTDFSERTRALHSSPGVDNFPQAL